MGVLPKEVVREIIKENNFQTPQEIVKNQIISSQNYQKTAQ